MLSLLTQFRRKESELNKLDLKKDSIVLLCKTDDSLAITHPQLRWLTRIKTKE